ncbi:uncharacterized protein At4g08330, chloroplastic-like [Curcuma longa]|uniref:uncharacterized protein At4g08330, chloroplastic-like n=1 Tax=Curcuma longa TaxID=136217 RepID=UPI003D9F9018
MAFRGDLERPQTPAESASESLVSPRFVSYCCGSCGYALNLSSADRYMTNIGAKYRKSIKKGIVSFVSVDESRFSQVEELRCRPYFESWQSWGLMRRRTKLFCRNCRNFVGVGHQDGVTSPVVSDSSDSGSGNGEVAWKKYDIKIKALQPLSWDNSGIPLSV